MNKNTLLVLSCVFLMSGSAHAWVRDGWARPLFRAELAILDQEGRIPEALDQNKPIELVMTQQDGATSPKGFVLLIDGQFKEAYEVKSASTDRCNTVVYTLAGDTSSEMIQVMDHSNRTCRDMLQYRWEMNVRNIARDSQVLGQAHLGGNPHSVITPF